MDLLLMRGIKTAVAFLVSIPLMLPLTSTVSFANDPICVFVSQKGSAWVIRKDSSVKASLKIGDVLFPGDEVLVLRGNSIQLAFDKDVQNVVQVDGESLVRLIGGKPFNIELFKGKVFAVINKKDVNTQFSITTPTAVAAVRGTQYQVTYQDEKTNVYTYQGSVRVSGRKDGKELPDYVVVAAGQKTTVTEAGKKPEPPKAMNRNELIEIQPVLNKAQENADSYREQVAQKFEPPAKAPVVEGSLEPAGQTPSDAAASKKTEDNKSKKSQSIPSKTNKESAETTGNRVLI
ncbi:MAG: FecR family protein [Candidatus Omnitrophota bacterium]